jgi:hypothetical protein
LGNMRNGNDAAVDSTISTKSAFGAPFTKYAYSIRSLSVTAVMPGLPDLPVCLDGSATKARLDREIPLGPGPSCALGAST